MNSSRNGRRRGVSLVAMMAYVFLYAVLAGVLIRLAGQTITVLREGPQQADRLAARDAALAQFRRDVAAGVDAVRPGELAAAGAAWAFDGDDFPTRTVDDETATYPAAFAGARFADAGRAVVLTWGDGEAVALAKAAKAVRP